MPPHPRLEPTFCRATMVLLAFLFCQTVHDQSLQAQSSGFINGVDISSLPQIEAGNGIYTMNGIENDLLAILQESGVNYVRLRIWHTPLNGATGLSETLAMAQRLAEHNMGFLLDFHYSDTWADPAHQTKPQLWQGISFEALADSVYQYTFDVIQALVLQNTAPDMVQLGNEISCGLLWDDGRVCAQLNTAEQWQQLATLLDAGSRAVHDAKGPTDSIRVMIHSDRGGDNAGSRWFFGNLLSEDFDFDIIGLSYYPWWHGEPQTMLDNATDLAQRYDKDVIIVETAYPWTLAWNDDTHNIIGNSSQLLDAYPASVDGQGAFLRDIIEGVQEIPAQRGIGIFYWAPEWIAAPNFGSPWENLALFDFDGEALASLAAFDSTVSDLSASGPTASGFKLYQNYPNPFNPATTIHYELPTAAKIRLSVYDLHGRQILLLFDGLQPAGQHRIYWQGQDEQEREVASGIYMIALRTERYSLVRKMILLR